MPSISLRISPHLYWLTASLLWLLLCLAILPCFGSKEAKREPVGMDVQEGPMYATKPHAVQPFVKIEVDESKRVSVLTHKSKGSSESIEKGICEEKAEREALEKPQEEFRKSSSFLEEGKLTQSGEFLNECMGSLEPDKPQEEEAECEVHIEREYKELKLNLSAQKNDAEEMIQSNESTDSDDAPPNEIHSIEEEILAEGTTEQKEYVDDAEGLDPDVKQNESDPLVLQEGDIYESEILKDEEVSEIQDGSPVKTRKPRPTVDTSRASGYYECSMPTPKSASDRPESNMVFLFVNPETAATEDDIIVNHQGEVQKQEE